jgi:conjugal transfer/entry exclusion protein
MIKERKKKAEGKEKAIQDVIVQNQLLEKERKQEIKLRSQAAEMRKLELAEHREQEALKK